MFVQQRSQSTSGRQPSFAGWRPPNENAYAYLLGIYLGDGCISHPRAGTAQLEVTLDSRYPGIVRDTSEAIRACVAGVHVGTSRKPGAIRVQACHRVWFAAFPQDGPGRKHTRVIELTDWQRRITRAHPRALLRGLIHSDGCRSVNRFTTVLSSGRTAEYAYVRYFFTNLSVDIQRIFCEHCDLLGIRWTKSSFKNISIAHRDSVAKLDAFVGPKY
jgi:hypothetical protein